MKQLLIVGIGLIFSFYFIEADVVSEAAAVRAAAEDSLSQARQRQVEKVLETIEGKEEIPAGEVFENIEILKQVPAGRLLRIMDMGFGRSLGVGCEHCHDVEDFASDDERPKRAAREMMGMVQTINQELLAGIENLETDRPESSRPTVNCTTCHRGEVTPAVDM